ncbi:alpha-L-rhamnosidase [Nocardioides sp. BE266]|uniref:family 78 glycoside hydrolase catalytic domain n=1 Tax=Nocardioides sp. BE266 TaxID=2817725 RepID=UPI002859CC48|nr:family 78 glycoside hydrolase catalytic domain [Nocardioides sp. BE266]MDR7255107.1 alpha-L-rhamnosidase [Nocardioides sp. BE266]
MTTDTPDIEWQAQWISPTATGDVPGRRPAYALRGSVRVDAPVRRATWHATAHGIYELSIDGTRVTADELTPGFTEYAHHTQVQTYDVTALLGEGAHTLDALLADGWYRGQVGILRATDQWGTETALLAQLELEHADGSRTVVGTDAAWQWSPSHIVAADLIEGQREDRRLVDSFSWQPVAVSTRGYDTLVAPVAPPVRAVEELRPVSVTSPRPGVFVVDLGQNINGRVRLTSLGPADTEITLTHGEALGPGGDVMMTHLQPAMPFLPEPLSAGQVDSVVSAGVQGDVFEPRFTTHGFQYVRVEGHPGPLTADDVTGVVVHTDMGRRGSFSCDVDRLNRLHDAAVWSFRGNACDVPTDCPTRERAGWTGDWQLYVPTASYLYDVQGFSQKWLRDLAVAQWPDGNLGNMAPMPVAEKTGFLEKMNGSAGWGDAIVLVPWELYSEYGDTATLSAIWPAMVGWLDRVERMASGSRHPDRVAKHPEPEPHEQYLWDTGFHWGEWLEPGGEPSDFPAFIAMDKSDVATAFYCWTASHAARIASLIGESSARYEALAEGALAAWRTEYVAPDGHITPHTQANLVRALTFGLVPPEHRQRAADDLAALVRSAGTHLQTGFLSTPDLLPALADHGHLDLAYELLLQDSEPSWLTMIDRGATTVWERWDGIREDGSAHESLNHYSKGAVISFLHRHVAGLQRLEPTWTRFRLAPQPGGGITRASTSHLSVHGLISVAWDASDGFSLEVTVPDGCVAEVVLPSGETYEVGSGSHTF